MNSRSTLAGALLLLGVIVASCWWVASRSSSMVRAPGPRRATEGVGSPPARFVVPPGGEQETLPTPASGRTERTGGLARGSETGEADAAKVGTTILVINSRTGEPVERFAIRIARALLKISDQHDRPRELLRDFPGGALVVGAPLQGFTYSVQAPGYLDQAGRIETVSPTDRRALIRLEPTGRVRGRLVFESDPVPVLVSLRRGSETSGFKSIDSEGAFEFEDLRAGSYTISVWAKDSVRAGFRRAGARPEQDLGRFALEAGEQLDLGDLTVSLPEEVAVESGGGRERKLLAARSDGLVLEGGESWDSIELGDLDWQVSSKGQWKRASSDGHARVRATNGGVPLTGAVVFLRKQGSDHATRAGTTDEAGELLVQLGSEKPYHLELTTSNLLYLGGTEFPVKVLPDQELEVWLPLRTGSLTIEIPDAFRPGSDRALQLMFESTVLPKPGYEMVTLHGVPEQLVESGILWTGNRCKLEALAPGHYRISADVQEKAQSKRAGPWKPTGISFAGEVEVRAGGSATCVLR